MKRFPGFARTETYSRIPDSLFHTLLRQIDDIAELKVTLYAAWRTEHTQEASMVLDLDDFDEAQIGLEPPLIQASLEKAVQRGTLLRLGEDSAASYVLNTPRGRETAEALQRGLDVASHGSQGSAPPPSPNVFRLYEDNIGPLTPFIADALKDAETRFSADWVEDAIREAARNNKRSLSYIEAILKRWKENGRGPRQNRRNAEKDGWDRIHRRLDELERPSEE